MDPLSLAATCVTLIGAVTRVSSLVTVFVRDVRSARSDLDAVSREFLSLKTVLELLSEDISDPTNESFPETLKKQIAGIVTNCSGVVAEIEQTLQKHESTRLSKAVQWATSGKSDIAKLQLSLEAHKSALEIALDMLTLVITKKIDAKTQEIHTDTLAIKQDTAQILCEISRLQEQLPRSVSLYNTSGFMLERYLEGLTSYAESVCDTFSDSVEKAAESEATSTCYARYLEHSLDQSYAPKPLNRRFVKLACPGDECDQDKICDWICSKCKAPVEYGYVDLYIYCDCGRILFNDYEFKCKSKDHGPEFTRYDPKKLLSCLKNLTAPDNLNILILGETGVGKSTFINAFVNYLTFETLDESVKAETLLWLVPCSFSIQTIDRSKPSSKIRQMDIKFGARDDEIEGNTGVSQTQRAVVYAITVGTTVIRLIDTPGIGDTRGIDYDRKNISEILSTLAHFGELHGILILLKPNISRLTVPFHYCLKELLSHLHNSSVNNIVFGFTNSRTSNYMPGDTFRPLKHFLSGRKLNGGLGISTDTLYCFDSESFRFLAAYKNGISLSNIQDFRRSWEHSRAEALRLLGYFRSQSPHLLRSTLVLNSTRNIILQLAKAVMPISETIEMTRDRLDGLVCSVDRSSGADKVVIIAAKEALEKRIKEYESERTQIQDAVVRLSIFLKSSSITQYNDATLEYLDFQIDAEKAKSQARDSTSWRLAALRRDRAKHSETIDLLTRNMQSGANWQPLTETGVAQVQKRLEGLAHFGKGLEAMLKYTAVSPNNGYGEISHRVKSEPLGIGDRF